jgi:HEAT repeat protein
MAAHELETRVSRLEKALSAFSQELALALRYIQADAASSLTKSRIVLEKLLLRVYAAEMGREPRKPLLGDMLSDNQFTRKIERRILSRMNAIRDMANLGPHGDAVEPKDAASVLDALCEVMDWYLLRYGGQAPGAVAGARAPSAPAPPGQGDTSPGASAIGPATVPPPVPGSLNSRGPGGLPRRWWIPAVSAAAPLVLVAVTIIVVRTGPGAGKVPAGGKDSVVDGAAKKDGAGKEEKHAAPKPDRIEGEPAAAEISPAVKAQLPGLEDKDARVRREAALCLRKLGDKAAVPALIRRIADDTWGDTKGPFAVRSDTPFEDVTTGSNQGSKYAALEALRELAPERVTEALQRALESRQPPVIEWALRNLAGQKANGATVQAVAEQLGHKDPRVRREAARTLAKLGDPAAVSALIRRIADDTWGDTRGPFVAAVRSDTPFEDVATGSNQGSKYAALEALKKLAPQEVVTKALGMAQQSGNLEVKKWALMELARPEDGK